ncbi:MAG TPA: tetratricopeptide repeat protein [Candidatus Dormibacteraeota bacterium]|nr:tetratricopeptide repeat protein [Candidatus Dormibacteraeota bacterium]
MRTICRLSSLLLLAAVAASPVAARAGEVLHLDGQSSTVAMPSDPAIVQREQRRADGGDLPGAIVDLSHYVAAHPDQRGPMVLLGDLYYRARQLTKAEDLYREALSLGDSRAIHNRLGGVYVLERRYDDAVREFRAALPLPSGFENLIAVHRMRGDLDRFEEQTAVEADRHPTDVDAALDLALVYDAQGRDVKALAAYHHVVDLDPNCAAGYNGIGSVLISERRYTDAIAPLQHALALDGRFVAALNNLGDASLGLTDLSSAQGYLERAHRIAPDDASVLVNLGVLADLRGNRAAALEDYGRAIQVDPFQVEAYYDMAADYDALGQHELAQAVTLKGLAIAADDGILHYNLAVIDDELGRHQDALEQYRKAAQMRNAEAARLARLALSAYAQQTTTSAR